MNRFMISAFKSGSGKTLLTCGMLAAFKKLNMKPAAFKCGPDYIDPLFHKEIIGVKGCNLDLFFTEENLVKQLFCEYSENADISVLEGAMGFYDGLSNTLKASACEVSNVLLTPVILVVDVKGSALTLCATINGVLNFSDNNIKGIILNNCKKTSYDMYKKLVEHNCDVKVFGYVPYDQKFAIESRHLGLVTASEISDLNEKLNYLADVLLETLDFDGIINLSNEAPEITFHKTDIEPINNKVKIAIAKDKAFCFYYDENLHLFKKLGAEIVYFSPLDDEKLPSDIDCLYIGGGYPELYLEQLSKNETMRLSILNAIKDGLRVFAECGGFMYLMEKIEGIPMVGAIKGESFNKNKLVRFGYIKLTANEDNILCKKGDAINAHEFHYYDSDNNGNVFTATKNARNWQCYVSYENLICGYPHLYFYSNISFIRNFLTNT